MHVDDIVNLHSGRELDSVRVLADAFKHLKGALALLVQLAVDTTLRLVSVMQSQEHLVTGLEQEWAMVSVVPEFHVHTSELDGLLSLVSKM